MFPENNHTRIKATYIGFGVSSLPSFFGQLPHLTRLAVVMWPQSPSAGRQALLTALTMLHASELAQRTVPVVCLLSLLFWLPSDRLHRREIPGWCKLLQARPLLAAMRVGFCQKCTG